MAEPRRYVALIQDPRGYPPAGSLEPAPPIGPQPMMLHTVVLERDYERLAAAATALIESDGGEGGFDGRDLNHARLALYAALGRPLTDRLRRYKQLLDDETGPASSPDRPPIDSAIDTPVAPELNTERAMGPHQCARCGAMWGFHSLDNVCPDERGRFVEPAMSPDQADQASEDTDL